MWIRNATKCVGWLEDNEALRCTSWTKMWCSMKCKWVPHKPFNQIQTPGWEGDWTISRAQGALNRLEIESHKIEKATWNLQNTPSQHHVTQGMGMRILQALTPRGFSLDMRTPEKQDLRWSHSISGTCFDTLPDLEEVTIILSYWHCLKTAWHSQAGTILVPSSGNITKLSQMLLWNHPYAVMEPFRQGILAFDETRGLQDAIPLTTTIQALGQRALRTSLHLSLPDWEAGHSDLHPRRNHRTEHTAKQVLAESIKSITPAWNHDGGEALGNLGNKILGGYKLVTQPASPSSLTRLWVKVIDHHTNRHTPWFRNTQVLPHRLRILGNPRTQSIDLQIPTQPAQTSLEAILLTLQIMGCERENLQYESERTWVFKTSQILRVGPCQPEPTRSEHKGILLLQPHSTFELTDRLTMFLPAAAGQGRPRFQPRHWTQNWIYAIHHLVVICIFAFLQRMSKLQPNEDWSNIVVLSLICVDTIVVIYSKTVF